MTPGGSASYAIRLPVSVTGDAQLQRVLDNLRSVRAEVTALASPLRNLTADTAALAVGMSAVANNTRTATAQIRSLVTALNNYVSVAQRAQSVPAPSTPRVAPLAGGGAGAGGSGGSRGGGGGRTPNYGGISGAIGGRIGGYLSGIPGGGFIGAQIARGFGISGTAGYALGGAAVAGLGAYELIKNAADTAKYAQEQQNLARELGTTVQFTQMLGRASEITGVQTSGLFSVIKDLNREITSTGSESKKAERALAELGLNASIAFETPKKQIDSLMKALSSIGNVQVRGQLATNLLGEGARQVLPLVDRWPQISSQAQGGLDASQIEKGAMAAERFARASIDIKDIWRDIGISIASALTGLGAGISGTSYSPTSSRRPWNAAEPLNARQWEAAGIVPSGITAGRLTAPGARTRADEATSIVTAGGTSVDRASRTYSDTKQAEDEALLAAKNGTGTLADLRAATAARTSAESNLKSAREFQSQQERFTNLTSKSIDISQMSGILRSLPGEFPALTGTTGYQSFQSRLQAVSGPFVRAEELGRQPDYRILNSLQTQYERNVTAHPESVFAGYEEPTNYLRRYAATNRLNATVAGIGERQGIEQARGGLSLRQGQQGIDIATQQAAINASRYSLSSIQFGRVSTAAGLANLRTSYGARYNAAGAEADTYLAAANKAGPLTEAGANYNTQAEQKNLEQKTILLELQAKEIEQITQFNDAVDKAAQSVREELAGGAAGIAIGAQNGGSRGALAAIRSFGEKQESTIIKNVLGLGLQHIGFGSTNPLGIGKNSALGKVFQGSVFGPVDDKQNVSVNANTISTDLNTRATNALVSVFGGKPGPNPSSSGDGSSGIGSISGTIGSIAQSGTTVASAAQSGSPSSIISAISRIASIGQGVEVAHKVGIQNLDIFGGSGGTSTSEKIGIAGALAGAAGGAYQGISTLSRGGGAKSIAGGTAETLASAAGVAALFGPAGAPVALGLAAAAAVAGLVATVLPDPRVQRALQIQKTLFTSQYLAPPTQNISVGGGGGFSDVDMYGNVRSSDLSPYPVIRDPYLDVPRRTVVPGGTVGTFGGQNITGAAGVPGAPVTIHVSTLDSKSFADNAPMVIDAINTGMNQGHGTALTNTLRQHLGQI